MAGTWIIMKHDLPRSPEVKRITRTTGADSVAVTVGRLFLVWTWADIHSDDGVVAAELEDIDDEADCDGFGQAMVDAGWLEIHDGTVVFPDFGDHNGQTAKTRAKAFLRQQRARRASCHASVTVERDNVTVERDNVTVDRDQTEQNRTLQNKTKKKKSAAGAACPPPIEYSAEFESWWKSYPTRPGASRGSKTQSHAEWVKLTPEQRTQLVKATNNLAKSDTFPKDAQRFLRPERGDRGGDPVWVGWIDLEPSRGLSRKNDRNTYGQDEASIADLLARMKNKTKPTGVHNAI